MAQIPGMLGEVFWGDPDEPLPNWREHPRPDGDEDNLDDPLTDEERIHLTGLIGVDTNDLAKKFGGASDDDDDDNEGEITNELD